MTTQSKLTELHERALKAESEAQRLREMLYAMVIEHKDNHYDHCSAQSGKNCDCFAGALWRQANELISQPL